MRRSAVAVSALALVLCACEGGGDPVEQALRDASAERQAATVADGQVSGSVRDAMIQDAAGPTPGDRAFATAEAAIHARMTAASGETVDQAYIAKMIEHHRGAVAMAEVALKESRDPEIRRMAQSVVDARTREMAEMEAWRPVTGE